jgi:hypothetical protein
MQQRAEYIGDIGRRISIGADTGGMEESIPTFIPALLVSLFLGGLSAPRAKKIFRLAALAIVIPPTCESESAPLYISHIFEQRFPISKTYYCNALRVAKRLINNF